MKKLFTLFVSVGILATGSVYAASEAVNTPLVNDGTTYLEQLRVKFANASLPAPASLVGWWSGRCFASNAPTQATAGLLVVQTIDIDPKVWSEQYGPIFPVPLERLFATFQFYANDPTNYALFDSLADSTKAQISQMLQSESKNVMDRMISPLNGAFVGTDGANFSISLRVLGNYILQQKTYIKADKDSDGTQRNAGDIASECYFFKKVN